MPNNQLVLSLALVAMVMSQSLLQVSQAQTCGCVGCSAQQSISAGVIDLVYQKVCPGGSTAVISTLRIMDEGDWLHGSSTFKVYTKNYQADTNFYPAASQITDAQTCYNKPFGNVGASGSIVVEVQCTNSVWACPLLLDIEAVCETYSWNSTSWNACESNCTQSRSVTCRSNTGAIVEDWRCSDSKPATSQSCTGGFCPVSWSSTNWGTCGSSCLQTRVVECKNSIGATISDAECGASPKPTTSQSCTGNSCTTSWNMESWSSCAASCTQTRSVTCKNVLDVAVADSLCTETKPATSQGCASDLCVTSWSTGNWDSCEFSCTQPRTVTCKNSAGATVADAMCSGAKPHTSQSCSGGSCVMSWSLGGWSSCGSTCYQTRSVTCQNSGGSTVGDSMCSESKPTTSQGCTGDSCPSGRGVWSGSFMTLTGCSQSSCCCPVNKVAVSQTGTAVTIQSDVAGILCGATKNVVIPFNVGSIAVTTAAVNSLGQALDLSIASDGVLNVLNTGDSSCSSFASRYSMDPSDALNSQSDATAVSLNAVAMVLPVLAVVMAVYQQ